mmetsp:Transcript_71875/g.187382  ORF Transcript_71875/g.187382 Transcript_71875/m.187382 type:complete len:265 (-) Transcript_71875:683-1477(-)
MRVSTEVSDLRATTIAFKPTSVVVPRKLRQSMPEITLSARLSVVNTELTSPSASPTAPVGPILQRWRTSSSRCVLPLRPSPMAIAPESPRLLKSRKSFLSTEVLDLRASNIVEMIHFISTCRVSELKSREVSVALTAKYSAKTFAPATCNPPPQAEQFLERLSDSSRTKCGNASTSICISLSSHASCEKFSSDAPALTASKKRRYRSATTSTSELLVNVFSVSSSRFTSAGQSGGIRADAQSRRRKGSYSRCVSAHADNERTPS